MTTLPHTGPMQRDEYVARIEAAVADLRSERGRTDKLFLIRALDEINRAVDHLRPFRPEDRAHMDAMKLTR